MKILSVLFIILLTSCACPESASIKSFADNNLPEYKEYVEKDDKLSMTQKRIRLLRIETFKAVADGLK